jgi:hypothetical protein
MKVSVIISNRNDVSMLAVTVRSVIEELRPLGLDNSEIVICDNSDDSIFQLIKSALPSGYIRDGLLKLIRQPFPCLFTARETAIAQATGQYILCLDSHMLCGRDLVLSLVNFMDSKSHDSTMGFAHAPISWAHQHEHSARHDRDMSVCELGNWGSAYLYPRTITWKGMPWICRREWFLNKEAGLGGYGALADHKLSWGGGDMHIGIKPWLLGYKNWAVPSAPGIHIGPFPKLDQGKDTNSCKVSAPATARDKYRLWSTSGQGPHALGFLVSCFILGGEKMMNRNKPAIQSRFGQFINQDQWWQKAMEIGAKEKAWLDKRKVMSFDELLTNRPWDNHSRNNQTGTISGTP